MAYWQHQLASVTTLPQLRDALERDPNLINLKLADTADAHRTTAARATVRIPGLLVRTGQTDPGRLLDTVREALGAAQAELAQQIAAHVTPATRQLLVLKGQLDPLTIDQAVLTLDDKRDEYWLPVVVDFLLD